MRPRGARWRSDPSSCRPGWPVAPDGLGRDGGYDEPVEVVRDGACDELPQRAEVACVGFADGLRTLVRSFLKMMAGGYPRTTRIRLSSSGRTPFPSRTGGCARHVVHLSQPLRKRGLCFLGRAACSRTFTQSSIRWATSGKGGGFMPPGKGRCRAPASFRALFGCGVRVRGTSQTGVIAL